MNNWVVDSSAILAFLNREPGQDRAREILSIDKVRFNFHQPFIDKYKINNLL